MSCRKNWGFEGGAEGRLPGPTLAVVAPAVCGTYVLLVDDTSKITPGGMVLLEVDTAQDHRLLREMAGDIVGAQTYDWATAARGLVSFANWRWPVVVTEVLSPRTVRTEQPLRLVIHGETPARLRTLGPNVNPGSNRVCFQAVHDCWATNGRAANADCAFATTSARISKVRASCTRTQYFKA